MKKKTWLFEREDLDDDLVTAMERKRPRGCPEGAIFDKVLKEGRTTSSRTAVC